MKAVVCLLLMTTCSMLYAEPSRWKLQRDDKAGQMSVRLDGREIMIYQYGKEYALPHYWPLRSPSGKPLTIQRPDLFPHHQSVWIADKVRISTGEEVDFYHYWKNFKVGDDPSSGYRHFIQHRDLALSSQAALLLLCRRSRNGLQARRSRSWTNCGLCGLLSSATASTCSTWHGT